jgi:hypothetical protein
MFGIGGFVIWWGEENRDLKIVEEADYSELFLAILLLGVFLLVVAVLGVIIAAWPNKLTICIYTPLICIFGLLLLISGAGMLYLRGEIEKTFDDRDDCRDFTVFEDADD